MSIFSPPVLLKAQSSQRETKKEVNLAFFAVNSIQTKPLFLGKSLFHNVTLNLLTPNIFFNLCNQ